MGAYDGYKYAKKKNLKGWKKGAAVVGGALLGAVNPFKVVKAAKTGYKAYKASKYTKKAVSAVKKNQNGEEGRFQAENNGSDKESRTEDHYTKGYKEQYPDSKQAGEEDNEFG